MTSRHEFMSLLKIFNKIKVLFASSKNIFKSKYFNKAKFLVKISNYQSKIPNYLYKHKVNYTLTIRTFFIPKSSYYLLTCLNYHLFFIITSLRALKIKLDKTMRQTSINTNLKHVLKLL